MEHHQKSHKKSLSKNFYTKIYVALAVALVIFALNNLLQISSAASVLDQKLAEATEAKKPAEVQLITISTPLCLDCYDIKSVVGVVESTGVNITSRRDVAFSSVEARSLIKKYEIEKVPTLIITGELSKSTLLASKLNKLVEEIDKAYIFTEIEPPFVETSSGDIRGSVSLTHLKKDSCEECFDLTPIIKQLGQAGLKFKEQKEIDADSVEGKKLLGQYDIKILPGIILDKEAEVYPNIMQVWAQLGSTESDGSLVMRKVSPPYFSVEEGMVKGLITMTVLTDNSCIDCYDPNVFHKPILQRIGVVFKEEREIDISDAEGKSLIEMYNIEKAPTILLEGDVEEYPGLVSAWAPVGSVESDGMYVFRRVEVAQEPYRNLSNNEVVKVKKTA